MANGWLTHPAALGKPTGAAIAANGWPRLALMAKGFRIVARRYRTKLGEIDLIARRGDLVLIVEVKARTTLVEAMEAIAHESERRIEGAADLWLVAAAGLCETVGALRHGGGAALALAGACRECLSRRVRDDTLPPIGRVTRIGRPPCGCVVSFCTGHGLVSAVVSKRKRDSRMASAMIASCMAKLAPMQTRGPAPNGRYWKRSILSRFPGWKRSGMKASGRPTACGGDAPSTA